jgi:threonine dehydrogenase-like Zn-dependent dehydrogenase
MLGRHADRIALARRFGATDIVSERGDAAIERVRELTGGLGAHSVLECVGHGESMRTAVGIAKFETHTWNTTGFEAVAPPDPRYCLAATGRGVFTDASAS